MGIFDTIIVTASIAGSCGYLLAWRIHRVPMVAPDDMVAYMGQITSQEEFLDHEHRMRTLAIRANRTAMPNVNSGPPARISRGVVKRGRD